MRLRRTSIPLLILALVGACDSGTTNDSVSDAGDHDAGDAAPAADAADAGVVTDADGGGTDSAAALFAVGGTLSGLGASKTVVLQNGGGDSLTVGKNGSFAFATSLATAASYDVTVETQPAGQWCVVAHGSGTVNAAPITNVTVGCGILMGGAVQGVPLAMLGDVRTLAGTFSSTDAARGAANFASPGHLASDGTYAYVSDGQTIRKIVLATGAVTTLAGTVGLAGTTDGTGAAARFSYPAGLALTPDGTTLYVADQYNNKIRKILVATGQVTTFAGSGTYGTLDGVGVAAQFGVPRGVATDGTTLYVSDTYKHTIRKVDVATATVTTLAGDPAVAGSTDGVGAAASFSAPEGLVLSGDGSLLYVADPSYGNIRKIVLANADVTTFAGSTNGIADGIGTAAQFKYPIALATDGPNLYVTDTNGATLRKIDVASKAVTTLAGSGGVTGSKDGTGPAARFGYPTGVAFVAGKVLVGDGGNFTIRTVDATTGVVATLASTPSGTDGVGAAARFAGPALAATDGIRVYVADAYDYTIRATVVATGATTTLAGSPNAYGSTDGPGTTARFNGPNSVTTDGTNVYVADTDNMTIRKIVLATGVVSTIAGSPGAQGTTDDVGSAARFYRPQGITTDGSNLYIADTVNRTIRKMVLSTGMVSTLAGMAGVPGAADGVGTAASFLYPTGITTDGTNVYVVDPSSHTVRRIVASTGEVTTLAGMPNVSGIADGIGSAAQFNQPTGITTDGSSLYVTDARTHLLRRIDLATRMVKTIAGTANSPGKTDGAAAVARFFSPGGITTDGLHLFTTDLLGYTIRVVE